MSQRKISLALGEYYHIYNRGNNKQVIFKNTPDHVRFQQLLYVMNSTEPINFRLIEKANLYEYERGVQLVAIGAYCLMPNHFHILLTPKLENGAQLFMQKLTTGYSMYFNKKYERTGSLFEGRFKSEHAADDIYLKYLFSYIHLNPVKLIQSDWKEVGIRNRGEVLRYLSAYEYSSLKDCFGERAEGAVLSRLDFPEYFLSKKELDDEMFGWLSYSDAL